MTTHVMAQQHSLPHSTSPPGLSSPQACQGTTLADTAASISDSLHFGYSSHQVERWFGFMTQQAIRRDIFRSVKDLVARIDHLVQHYNRSCRPFAWTAAADSILNKLARLGSRISGTAP